MRHEVAKQLDPRRTSPLKIPHDLYLPETGPPRTKVRRPEGVLPIPLDLYLRVSDGRSKRKRNKR